MKTVIRVLLGLFRLAAVDLLARANAVFAGMNLNPAYPHPPVPMSELRVAIDDFSTAITAALDGGSKAIADRNMKGDVLKAMLRKLSHYVVITCNDDLTTFLSSGFQAKPTIRKVKPTNLSESIRYIAPGSSSGQIVVSMVAAPRALSYELRWAPVASGGSPGNWMNQPVGNTRPYTVKGLSPGTAYAFQARAVLRGSEVTPWSESVTRICT